MLLGALRPGATTSLLSLEVPRCPRSADGEFDLPTNRRPATNVKPTDKEAVHYVLATTTESELHSLQVLGLRGLTGHFRDRQVTLSTGQDNELGAFIEKLHAAYKAAPGGWAGIVGGPPVVQLRKKR